MNSPRIITVALATFCLAVTVSACSDSPQQQESAGTVSETSISEAMPPEANATDVHFLGMMVPHHDQAIEMSEILLSSSVDDPHVRDLAERIKAGQERENEIMEQMARDWQQQDAMEHHSQHIANGMVMPETMDALRAMDGEELKQNYLELMYIHHDHVLAMTQDQIDNGGHAPLRDLAQEMMDVQTAEMAEMEDILGYAPSV